MDKIIKVNNATRYPDFIKICKFSQGKLKKYLANEIKKYNYEPIVGDGFLFAKGQNCEVLLTAHMDTVHKEKVRDYYEFERDGKHVLSSPQGIGGDDRCGIYMILQILRNSKYRPHILFCEDEEKGGEGSSKFITTKHIYELLQCKFLVELDRTNAKDLVFYDDDNADFHDFCEKVTKYKENYGSFSDISVLSPALGISSVNISCGYYHAHTTKEEVVMEEMFSSIRAVKKLLEESSKVEQFEYTERQKFWYGKYGKSYYSDPYGYDYGDLSKGYADEYVSMEFIFEQNSEHKIFDAWGVNEGDCFRDFFESNPTVCFNDIVDYYYI